MSKVHTPNISYRLLIGGKMSYRYHQQTREDFPERTLPSYSKEDEKTIDTLRKHVFSGSGPCEHLVTVLFADTVFIQTIRINVTEVTLLNADAEVQCKVVWIKGRAFLEDMLAAWCKTHGDYEYSVELNHADEVVLIGRPI